MVSATNPSGSTLDGRGVLITGCSSGIGRETAVRLAEHGFAVFATVRKESDAGNLRNQHLPNLIPVCPVDLTNLDHITNAARIVTDELGRRGQKGLYALINNAGGGSPAPVELMDLDEFHRELQTRVLGSVAMVQAFLPLLRQGSGRIIWILTPAMIPTPYVTSIHACDFAVNCVARTLEIELKSWRIPNIMIKCGGIKTPAGFRTTTDVAAVLQKEPRARVALYEKALLKWAKDMAEFDEKRSEPAEVAETVLKALMSRLPKRKYSVGYMAGAAAVLEALPQSVADWILKTRF